MNMAIKKITSLLLVLLSSSPVLAQSFLTSSSDNSVAYSSSPAVNASGNTNWHIAEPTQPADADSLLFPVTSTLTEGKVITTQVNLPKLDQPLFVIGDDATSIAWATEHADELNALHAIGLLTNTKTAARWKAIENETGLTLIPVSLDGLNQLVTVSHYPFLLSKNWLEQ